MKNSEKPKDFSYNPLPIAYLYKDFFTTDCDACSGVFSVHSSDREASKSTKHCWGRES